MKSKIILLAAVSVAALGLSSVALAQRGTVAEEIRALNLEPNIAPGEKVLGQRAPDEPRPIGAVLETRPPTNPTAKRAFKEQTRAVAAKTKTAITATVVAHGLDRAWRITFMPDGRMLISERPGRIRIVTQDGKVGEPIANVPHPLNFSDAGFLDVVLDPDFAQNRRLFYSYVELRTGGNGLTVVSATLSPDEKSLGDAKVIFTAPTYNNAGHYGGRMMITPDKKLLIGVGERIANQMRVKSQDIDSPLGKLLRVNLDGSAPADNPYAQLANADGTVWAIGLRNVEGLAYDSKGKLWVSDIGPQTGDEIDIVERAHNYGWPLASYGQDYSGKHPNGGATTWPGTDQPVYYWDPTTAPSGMTFYSGNLIPEWKGNLFVAQLTGSHVSRLIIKNNKVVGEERLLQDQKQRVRDVAQGPDGALWVLTDNSDGRLIRLAPAGK